MDETALTVRVVPPLELMVLVASVEVLSQFTLPVTEVVMEMVRALALVVVMAMLWEAWLLAPAVRLRAFGEALREVEPPEPPPSKFTLIVTGVELTPAGPVGVRVTMADAPELIPAVVLFLKLKERDAGVVRLLGVTTSQFPEPELSVE